MEFPKDAIYKNIILSKLAPIAVIQLHRPEALNSLSRELMSELASCLEELDDDGSVNAVIITGGEDVFAAGADIKEMVSSSMVDMVRTDSFNVWDRIRRIRKPMIAAVNGFALGGGCELAMICDIIIASETAKFGQPEINIGVMPGAGGTQRLTRSVGKHRAMQLVLTGQMLSADEAMKWGLVNNVVPPEVCIVEAIRLAKVIASKPAKAVILAKEAVNQSFDLPLSEGLKFERRNFYTLFSSEDQKEGMKAFIEKRTPKWKGK